MFSSLLFTAAVITTNKSYALTHPYYRLQECNCYECVAGAMQEGVERKRLCSKCSGHVANRDAYDYNNVSDNSISVLGGPCSKNCGNVEGTQKPEQMDGATQQYGSGYKRNYITGMSANQTN